MHEARGSTRASASKKLLDRSPIGDGSTDKNDQDKNPSDELARRSDNPSPSRTNDRDPAAV